MLCRNLLEFFVQYSFLSLIFRIGFEIITKIQPGCHGVLCGRLSMAGHETKKFWLIIDGKIVTDHKIEAYTFGKILNKSSESCRCLSTDQIRGTPENGFQIISYEYR